METYASVLLYAIPGFIVLVLIELAYGFYKKEVHLNLFDTISSLSSGISNSIKDSLGLVIMIISYPFLYKYLALQSLTPSIGVYLIAFICIDFSEYWVHRISHKVNIFWNRHVIHHSSEEFNLPCALRQPVSNIFGIFAIFLIPAALIGVPVEVIALVAPLHLFMQFWYHTRYIGKLSWLEYIIVTPSQHRVHHAINPEYIDKNLAAIFCIWDRIFGTFQEEMDHVPPVYGTLQASNTWNPFLINFKHVFQIFLDAWHAEKWLDKIRIWFMPTGWRPEDVDLKFTRDKIEDVYAHNKYQTFQKQEPFFNFWVSFRFVSTLAFLLHLLSQFSLLSYPELVLYGLGIAGSIFAYTSLMDRCKLGVLSEVIFGCYGLIIILTQDGWFAFGEALSIANILLTLYFISIILYAFYIHLKWNTLDTYRFAPGT